MGKLGNVTNNPTVPVPLTPIQGSQNRSNLLFLTGLEIDVQKK